MTELSPELKKLLSQARDAYSPADERVTAVRDALSARLGPDRGGGGGGAAGGGGSTGLGFGLRAWSAIGLATALLAVGLFARSEREGGPASDASAASAPALIESGSSSLPASAARAPHALRAARDEPPAQLEHVPQAGLLQQDVSSTHPQPSAADAAKRPAPARARASAVASRASATTPRTAAAAKSASTPSQSTTADGAQPLPPGDARPPRVASAAEPAAVADARRPLSDSSSATSESDSFTSNANDPAPSVRIAPALRGGESSAPPARAAPSTPQLDDSLAAEITLLRRASRALTAGRAVSALALADEHETRFPHGRLRQERLATRALALCALGRLAEARSSTGALLEIAPRSPHLMKIRASCPAQVSSSQAH